MVDHTVNAAIPIFNAAFPSCQAMFLFDNASSHPSYVADALRAENMNLPPESKQGMLWKGFMHGKGQPQSMSFPLDFHNLELAGKPKGIKRVLKERGLWPGRGSVLECPTTQKRLGCNSEGAATLTRFLGQRKIFGIRKDAFKRR